MFNWSNRISLRRWTPKGVPTLHKQSFEESLGWPFLNSFSKVIMFSKKGSLSPMNTQIVYSLLLRFSFQSFCSYLSMLLWTIVVVFKLTIFWAINKLWSIKVWKQGHHFQKLNKRNETCVLYITSCVANKSTCTKMYG